MKILKNKFLTCILSFLMIPQVCAHNGATTKNSEPRKMSTLGKVITGTVVTAIGATALYFTGDKISYECHKSENGVDMRKITERGYNNKGVSVDSLSNHEERYCYLLNKWVRTWKGCCKPFYNRIPVIFAQTFPTVKDLSTLTDYDIFEGKNPDDYRYYTPQLHRETVRHNFAKRGILKYFADMEISAAHAGGFGKGDQQMSMHYVSKAMFPLLLSSAPNDEYFKIYYYEPSPLEDDFCTPTPYERFDYQRWARDVFHTDFKTVLNKHHEVFVKNGAQFIAGNVEQWDLSNLNLPAAEQEIDSWRLQQHQTHRATN